MRIGELIYKRRYESVRYDNEEHIEALVPNSGKTVRENYKNGRRLNLCRTSDDHFIVISERQYEVYLANYTC